MSYVAHQKSIKTATLSHCSSDIRSHHTPGSPHISSCDLHCPRIKINTFSTYLCHLCPLAASLIHEQFPKHLLLQQNTLSFPSSKSLLQQTTKNSTKTILGICTESTASYLQKPNVFYKKAPENLIRPCSQKSEIYYQL